MTPLYFDANATHGPLPEIIQGVAAVCARSWNPSAVHAHGQTARALVETARDHLRHALGAPKSRVIFTSGATEANNLALEGILDAQRSKRGLKDIVISAVEHPSIDGYAGLLEMKGVQVSRVSPRSDRLFYPEDFAAACSETTALVSVIGAHNETGQILPLTEIVHAVKKQAPQAAIHSDLVQWFGKLPIQFTQLGIDAITVSGHKIGALPGVGALVTTPDLHLEAVLVGGAQELRFRAGTENVPGIWSFGIAAQQVSECDLEERASSLKSLRIRLIEAIRANVPDSHFYFEVGSVLPNTVNLHVTGCAADDLVVSLDLAGLRASTGSACSSGKQEPSVALLRWGLSEQVATESIRLSFLPTCTEGEIDRAAEVLAGCVKRSRLYSH